MNNVDGSKCICVVGKQSFTRLHTVWVYLYSLNDRFIETEKRLVLSRRQRWGMTDYKGLAWGISFVIMW